MQVYCNKKHQNSGSNRFCTHCGEPLPLPIGQVVENRYQIVRILGQGGFGRSYLALDNQKSLQQCVLKEFAPQVQKPQDLQKAKELFEREASVLKKLQHPQIPRFHASLQAKLGKKDFFFLVQDYVEGDNYDYLLEQRKLQGQAFSEEEVVNLLHKILPVLSYIHSLDVVHRDISPDNLIERSSDKLPMLIDFGGVKQLPAHQGFWFTQLAPNRTLLGKEGYAPEEQLRQGQVFKSSDLYSLAVTVLVLLTGKEPQKLYDSYNGVWFWGKEIRVSPRLEAVLKKMLAYKPSDRYQTADQVLRVLPSSTSTQAANPHITKLKTMVAAPGRQRVQAIASRFHSRTQSAMQSIPMPDWFRPFAVTLVGTTAIVLVGAGTVAIANFVIRGVTSITVPSISLPQIPSIGNPSSKPGSDKNKTRDLQKILNRLQQQKIPAGFFTKVVDESFYTKRPELNKRTLSPNPEDAALRNEWYDVAEDLLNKIERANLSTAARQKLGSYSQQDEAIWRRLAQAGQLGKYKTFTQVKDDTYKTFNPLFPGQERGKLNQQTFLQIWYAIAADKVSKAQSGN
ncbi:serine/threonine protein kinase [Cylindrospermum stagnale PCC 7417]|uniref:non-specific serine/threonine protein kinase n=1 Tax=Cylindrospermum stagnale PCC 7417 TaxID=56107 RepID=K9WR93_9NOST|nr:serine/threonine-protein kinase [Cylindrospermum stagnale]AFZ22708.1 serine/threonine protein kinase [Cylindrospermum stagnale PCC 7417]